MDNPIQPSSKVALIKNLYLFLVSFVALMMMVFSLADVINIALKTYIFTKADKDFYAYPEPICEPVKPMAKSDTTTPAAQCVSSAEQAKRADENRSAQRQRDLVRDLSMIIVGVPLFAYHWWLVRRKES